MITYENNFLFSKEWNNSEECLVNTIIDKHDEIRQEFILNLIGYLNLVLLNKFSQRIGYQFYQQKTQLKEVLHISIMIISYGTINLSTLSNKLLYNKLVNVKFSKLISAYHWINYSVLSEKTKYK